MVFLMVWYGQGDNIVNLFNGDSVVCQFICFNDWVDDGQSNGLVLQVLIFQNGQVKGGYVYLVVSYFFKGCLLIEYYWVVEMGYVWSGGLDDLLFSDGKGLDVSLLMWNFFKQYSC